MVVAAFFATLVGANRTAAVLPSCITNPVTIPPVYAFNYWVGSWFLDGPPVTEVNQLMIETAEKIARLDLMAIGEQLVALGKLSGDVLGPLLLGSCLVGAVLGVVVYAVTLRLVTRYRARKELRRAARAARAA